MPDRPNKAEERRCCSRTVRAEQDLAIDDVRQEVAKRRRLEDQLRRVEPLPVAAAETIRSSIDDRYQCCEQKEQAK